MGGHSGLGLSTTRALAEAGATVVVAARARERARSALADIPRVEVEELDHSDELGGVPASRQRTAMPTP